MSERQLSTRDLAETTDTSVEEDAAAEAEAVSPDDQEPQLGGREREDDREEMESQEPLLPADQTERFTERWQEIQTSFVDQPRQSVEQADALVADLMQRLAASFSDERENLEAQWDRGDDVSTEDLRLALTRYRSFFDRLLSA
jgi:hypothetical protein